MGDKCKQQCERKCQVWQLAVGGESNTNAHMHLPCVPGGGRPGGGQTGRTYEGGCRSTCNGSVRYPVKHFYPVGRIKKWFIDTKEWFWDGMFVMRRKNPTKSASHYCLPFPRPTMRLPRSRSCSRRLVEVHHVHPPPPPGVIPGLDEPGLGNGARQQNSVDMLMTQVPLQEGSDPKQQLVDGSNNIPSQRSDNPPELRVSADEAELHQPPKAEAEKQRNSPSNKVVRISHINVQSGSPEPVGPGGEAQLQGKNKDPIDRICGEFTCIDYRARSLCPRIFRRRFCRHTGCYPCIPIQWKFLVRRGFVIFFTRTAGACLCLSSTCATLSFCLRNVARTVDAVATTPVDVKELPSSYVFMADMPGLKHSDIKVQVENDSILKICGDRRRDDSTTELEIKYIRVERNPGKLMRKFNLPVNTNLDGISAVCQDGLLTVLVPKNPQADPSRPRTFDVNVSPTSVSPQ